MRELLATSIVDALISAQALARKLEDDQSEIGADALADELADSLRDMVILLLKDREVDA